MALLLIFGLTLIQIFGYRHAALFLKKEIMKEEEQQTLSRLHKLTGLQVDRSTIKRDKQSLINQLKEYQKKGINRQWLSLIPFCIGAFMQILGAALLFNVPLPISITLGALTESAIMIIGIGIGFYSISLAFPGMLLEFVTEKTVVTLHKKH